MSFHIKCVTIKQNYTNELSNIQRFYQYLRVKKVCQNRLQQFMISYENEKTKLFESCYHKMSSKSTGSSWRYSSLIVSKINKKSGITPQNSGFSTLNKGATLRFSMSFIVQLLNSLNNVNLVHDLEIKLHNKSLILYLQKLYDFFFLVWKNISISPSVIYFMISFGNSYDLIKLITLQN